MNLRFSSSPHVFIVNISFVEPYVRKGYSCSSHFLYVSVTKSLGFTWMLFITRDFICSFGVICITLRSTLSICTLAVVAVPVICRQLLLLNTSSSRMMCFPMKLFEKIKQILEKKCHLEEFVCFMWVGVLRIALDSFELLFGIIQIIA